VIERQLRQMARLIDDLLDVSRISRGRLGLQRRRVELSRVLERALETAQPPISAKLHRVTLRTQPKPLWVDADPARLEQVFSNLLNNAAKYTNPQGQIDVSVELAGADVLIRVRDDGIGIAPEALPRIFDMFVQLPESREHSQGGLGIGLTLVRAIVELHGGTIEVSSPGKDRGSEFVVRMPRVDGGDKEAERVATPQTVNRERAVALLVVDDNVDAALTLAEYLAAAGHSVRVAHDGPRALELARADPPQVALLDLDLPGMTGYEVAAQLRDEPVFRSTRLIALTGFGQEADRQRSRDSGFADHLVKPIDPEVIDRLLREG
jgi:CheY-like chemotaxis protein/two-component sensor histidine kinase